MKKLSDLREKGLSFGQCVKFLREQMDLNQGELAFVTGIAKNQICKIETGAWPPPPEEKVVALADALKVDRDELVTFAGLVPRDICLTIIKNPKWCKFLRKPEASLYAQTY